MSSESEHNPTTRAGDESSANGHGDYEPKLPIKSVNEIIDEAGEDVSWLVENQLVRWALTVFAGRAKLAGKTTYWCHGIAAGARGEEHGGFITAPARYLYLTEQGHNFADYLRDSGLVDHPNHIRVVQFKDVFRCDWERITEGAFADAKNLGMNAVVIDPFSPFAGLTEGDENDAGVIGPKLRHLRGLAQRFNIAANLIHHLGKDGTLRGSSAFEAEADILVYLTRPEGRHGDSVRHLKIVGRYGLMEHNVELRNGRFVSLGDDNKVEFNKAIAFIKSTLPNSPENGMRKKELIALRRDADDTSVRTLERALGWLVMKGVVGEKELRERGKPKVYWLAETRFREMGPEKKQSDNVSRQTPTPTQGGLARNKLSRQTNSLANGGERKNRRENGLDKPNTILSRQTFSLSREIGGEYPDGLPSGDQRHVSIEPESERKDGNEGKVAEHQPDHLSPSPASDAAASQTAPMSVQDGNVALSNGGRLTAAEVERVKGLMRSGFDAGSARVKVLAERRAMM